MVSSIQIRLCRVNVFLDPDAVAIARELDGLPLALATAGAYLDQVSTSFSDYLRLYSASWLKLQQTSPEVSSYEDRALYSTWQLSFDHIKQQNELSAKLLLLWAYFDNEDIWFELLRHGASSDLEWVLQLTEDELSFNQAMRVLCNHGLAEVDKSSEDRVESIGYKVHSCVHSWTIHVLNQQWDYRMAGLALRCVGSHVPDNKSPKFWLTQRRLVQHAARCSYFISKGLVQEESVEWALYSLGFLYSDQGKLVEAETMYQRALQGYENAWGLEHTSVLSTVNSLGVLYKNQGKLDEAEKMFQRALQGKEKAWGPEHTSTLDTILNLGTLYVIQGKLDEAEKMYQRALQGYEKAWGPDHISTLQTVSNLGILYTDQGKLDEAEKVYQRALQGFEKALGPEHTSTLSTVNNLGVLYKKQDKLDEAEKMFQRAQQGYENALGLEHISTIQTVSNLGILYTDQGKLDEAEKMYQRAQQGYEYALGPEHISTPKMDNNLSVLFFGPRSVQRSDLTRLSNAAAVNSSSWPIKP
jgi:tetratricopeptide (TPR) repeat protein